MDSLDAVSNELRLVHQSTKMATPVVPSLSPGLYLVEGEALSNNNFSIFHCIKSSMSEKHGNDYFEL